MSAGGPARVPLEGRGAAPAVAARVAPAPVALSAAMQDALGAADDVAASSTTVLILGESGTGKEILARYIHHRSRRAGGPWVAVNCAALPPDLLEGELFGHERGAFTGATERRIGRIERANHGTLLLDEISELPLSLQAKLLRVLQEREIDRIGGARPVPVDVRVIATSNRSLKDMTARGELRADLYYRLDVFSIALPPLRHRPEDIAALAEELLGRLAASQGRAAPVLGADARRALGDYHYPGNVRELGNILERALVRCRDQVLDLRHIEIPGLAAPVGPATTSSPIAFPVTAPEPELAEAASEVTRPGDPIFPEGLTVHLPSLERLAIGEALRLEGGNRTRAARRLGVSLRTLRNKLREYRLESDAAELAARQELLGNDGRHGLSRDRSPTLAQSWQSTSRRGRHENL